MAAHCAEQVKARKYNSFAERMNHGLAVLAVETTGAFGEGLLKWLHQCSDRHDVDNFQQSAESRSWSSDTFKRYWMQRLAIAYWRGAFQMVRAQLKAGGEAVRSVPPAVEASFGGGDGAERLRGV